MTRDRRGQAERKARIGCVRPGKIVAAPARTMKRVVNLSTRKSRVFAEAMRVLRPAGRICITDLVLDDALPEDVLKSPAALSG